LKIYDNINSATQFIGRADQGPIAGFPAYHFRILRREGLVCLLEKSRGGLGPPRYEVVVVELCPLKRFPGGNETPAHEKMPSPEKWGFNAWSLLDLEAAKAKFSWLVDRMEKPTVADGLVS
jgi:hypothetical protein